MTNTLSAAATAMLEQVRRHPGSQLRQLFTAFMGLAMIVVLPIVLVYWARKKYRP